MKIGDSVWIIRGMNGPAVLRKASEESSSELNSDCAENHFALIGETYVHGIVHGDGADKFKPEWKDIVLM